MMEVLLAALTVLATLGDSITWGGNATDRSKTSYGAIIAQQLGAQWTNLGIPGETLIPEPNGFLTGQTANGKPYAKMGGVLGDEVSKIPIGTTLVTLYIGTNDEWMTESTITPDFANEATLIKAVSAAWQADMASLIAGIKARAPNAKIVVGTVLNFADKGDIVHLTSPQYLRYRQGITDMVNAMNEAIAEQGVTIADLHCDPALYDVANYTTKWDVHPTDAGHARIAQDFLAAIQDGGTLHHCAYDSVIADDATASQPRTVWRQL